MLAWGFSSGQWSPSQFANRAKAAGYEWAALEYDDPSFNPEQWYPLFRDACAAEGILPGVWFTEGGNLYRTPPDARLAIAEIEGPGDYQGVMNVLNAGQLPSCPLGIVTNFSTLTREECKPLIEAGFTALPEAYANADPNETPDAVDWYARVNLGFGSSQPVAGRWTPYDYSQWESWPLVDYLAEYVL